VTISGGPVARYGAAGYVEREEEVGMLVINPQTASGSLAAALLAEEEYDDVLAPLPSVAEAEAAAEEALAAEAEAVRKARRAAARAEDAKARALAEAEAERWAMLEAERRGVAERRKRRAEQAAELAARKVAAEDRRLAFIQSQARERAAQKREKEAKRQQPNNMQSSSPANTTSATAAANDDAIQQQLQELEDQHVARAQYQAAASALKVEWLASLRDPPQPPPLATTAAKLSPSEFKRRPDYRLALQAASAVDDGMPESSAVYRSFHEQRQRDSFAMEDDEGAGGEEARAAYAEAAARLLTVEDRVLSAEENSLAADEGRLAGALEHALAGSNAQSQWSLRGVEETAGEISELRPDASAVGSEPSRLSFTDHHQRHQPQHAPTPSHLSAAYAARSAHLETQARRLTEEEFESALREESSTSLMSDRLRGAGPSGSGGGGASATASALSRQPSAAVLLQPEGSSRSFSRAASPAKPPELAGERSGRIRSGRSAGSRHGSGRRSLKSPTGSLLGSEFSGSDVSDMSFTSEIGEIMLPPDRSWMDKLEKGKKGKKKKAVSGMSAEERRIKAMKELAEKETAEKRALERKRSGRRQ
jgi:hypothetical protein